MNPKLERIGLDYIKDLASSGIEKKQVIVKALVDNLLFTEEEAEVTYRKWRVGNEKKA